MTDLHTYGCNAEALKTYAFRVDFDQDGCAIVEDDLDHSDLDTASPSQEIDRLAKQRQLDHPTANISYAAAVQTILAQHPDLHAAYAVELKTHRPNHKKRINPLPSDERLKHHSDPSLRVHARAVEIQEDKGIRYVEAVQIACQRDPTLAGEYAA